VIEVALGAAGVHGLIVGLAQLLGYSVSGLLDHPFRSTPLGEYWGRRWNRMVQINLATGFYRPLARAGFAWTRTLLLFLALSPGLIEPLAAVANVHGRRLTPPEASTTAR